MARRLGVSRDDVIAAAVTVSDRDGFGALTVAAVADEVGCRPPSVYHHVDGLSGLAQAVALHATRDLIDRLNAATEGTEGMETLKALTATCRDWGRAHPTRVDATMLQATDDEAPELGAARDEVLLQWQDAVAGIGVPASERPPLVSALMAATHGCVSIERAAAQRGNLELADARRAGQDLLVELLMDHLASLRATAG